MICVGIFCGLVYQLGSSFFNFQVGVYVTELLLIDMVQFGCLIVMAVLCHVISPNKYVGYFAFIAFIVANSLIWPLLGLESKMLQYGSLPGYTYSDFFGRQPYAPALSWFAIYWGLLAAVFCMITIVLWPRGRETGFAARMGIGVPRFKGGLRLATLGLVIAWTACGAWVFWNTEVRNPYDTKKQENAQRAPSTWSSKNCTPRNRARRSRSN